MPSRLIALFMSITRLRPDLGLISDGSRQSTCRLKVEYRARVWVVQHRDAIGRRLRRMHLVARVDPSVSGLTTTAPQPSRSSLHSPLLVRACPAHMETWLYVPLLAYWFAD